MKPVCLDSSAWIEIAHNGANAKVFLKALGDMSEVIVSTITLYEVWKYTAVNADESRALQIMDVLQQGTIVSPDADISLRAAQLSIRYKTAMADSLIYATSLAHQATLWTQDNDFKGLPKVKYFPKAGKA
jgi:predicted nucleic acid-binding protein